MNFAYQGAIHLLLMPSLLNTFAVVFVHPVGLPEDIVWRSRWKDALSAW